MPDSAPASPNQTVVVDDYRYGKLRTLTFISLGLNALILLLIIGGAICRHHQMKHHRGWDGERGGWGMKEGHRGFQQGGFHRFGGHFGPRHGWGDGQGSPGGPGFRQGAFGGQGPMGHGPGPMGGPGMGFGGPRGMMGGPGGDPHDPAKMTDAILGMLTQKLTLTDDQKAKIKPIVQDQVAQIQKDIEAQRAATQKKIEDAKAKIKPILNADQQKQLDAMQIPGQKPPAADAPKVDKK